MANLIDPGKKKADFSACFKNVYSENIRGLYKHRDSRSKYF